MWNPLRVLRPMPAHFWHLLFYLEAPCNSIQIIISNWNSEKNWLIIKYFWKSQFCLWMPIPFICMRRAKTNYVIAFCPQMLTSVQTGIRGPRAAGTHGDIGACPHHFLRVVNHIDQGVGGDYALHVNLSPLRFLTFRRPWGRDDYHKQMLLVATVFILAPFT